MDLTQQIWTTHRGVQAVLKGAEGLTRTKKNAMIWRKRAACSGPWKDIHMSRSMASGTMPAVTGCGDVAGTSAAPLESAALGRGAAARAGLGAGAGAAAAEGGRGASAGVAPASTAGGAAATGADSAWRKKALVARTHARAPAHTHTQTQRSAGSGHARAHTQTQMSAGSGSLVGNPVSDSSK